MSEYQYYEFLAIDRPLTRKQIDEVRQFSTRAEITSTRFVNEYHLGDFHGDPDLLVSKYFDVMVYYANWGTRRLLIGLSPDVAELRQWRQYESESGLEIRKKADRLIVEFSSASEDGYEYEHFEEGGNDWMASLSPIRGELLGGDLRPLIIGWLAGFGPDEEADEPVPPILPGLGKLTAAQQTLANFLRTDRDLLEAAAKRSPPETPQTISLEQWVRLLPAEEKDPFLVNVVNGQDPNAAATLMRRYKQESQPASLAESTPGETMASLRSSAAEIREAREIAERAARERVRARDAAQAAAERERRLEQLMAGEEQAWREVERIINSKQTKGYDAVVNTFRDLREVSIRNDSLDLFTARVRALRQTHRNKSAFLQRLDTARLLSGGATD